MAKSLIMRLAKSYLIGSFNNFLERNKDDAKKVAEQVDVWTTRLNTIIANLNRVAKFVEDGKIDDDEAKKTFEIISETVRSF